MPERSATLQAFLASMHATIQTRTHASDPAALAAGRIFAALGKSGTSAPRPPNQAAACRHLEEALLAATQAGRSGTEHASALADLAPDLAWYTRPGSDTADECFTTGHANATIIGNGGLEECPNVRIGVSLLAPDVHYPDHRHPPEEVYVPLSSGAWRQDDGPWREPGLDGIVYNPPNILHAMRSASAPLLATWCLWGE